MLRCALPFLLLLLGACGGRPEYPKFPERTGVGPENVVLGTRLHPEDLRRILDSINVDGSLDSLVDLVRSPSDAALNEAGLLLTQYVYLDATSPRGFVQL